jgi:hypothetical protein
MMPNAVITIPVQVKKARRIASSGMLRRVALVTSQKTPFFIATAVKTSNLTLKRQDFTNYLSKY